VAVRRAAGLLAGGQGNELPETFWYTAKRRLLGPPMVNEQLRTERLSKPLALGVLSCDGISSAAYGTEEMLIVLVAAVGLTAFNLIIPMTLVILFGIIIVVLSYREVVTVYTRAGGSYVVARENFGPRVAQVAAVALLIDYVVTVAVQTAAAAAVIVSAFPSLSRLPSPFGPNILDVLAVLMILVMCYGNLRGIREAGKTFALPTYLFSGAVGLMIIIGLIREAMGNLHHVPHYAGTTFALGHGTQGLLSFAMIYILLKAYANGGSSLTGIEAVSNAVSALRPPEGRNARQILVMQGSIVIFLIGGISWLSHVTRAIPYTNGYPTVLAQEANVVFGSSGHVLYWLVIIGTAAILFTGGNTSFSGFPFLASFVAEDSFLPRWLTKRGHRLVFSNGIIILTIVSLTLGLVVGFNVDGLVPFYAIGVFTGFSMAGFGMARYHLRTREPGWRRRLVINTIGGVYTVLVVFIFAVVKFKEGAWLVVIVGPILVLALIRLNREYRTEARVLESIGERRASDGDAQRPPNYTRRVVIVFVDDFDLSTIAALRYAKSLRPTTVRAVHFVIDSEKAERLRAAWLPDRSVSLDLVDCPDRRLTRCAADLVSHEAETPGTQVTAILPRRSFSPLLGRFLHDRTADKIAGVVSRVPNAAATIIPFDVQNRIRVLQERQAERDMKAPAPLTPLPGPPADAVTEVQQNLRADLAAATPNEEKPEPLPGAGGYDRPIPPPGVDPIGALHQPGRVTVEGRVRVLEIRPVEQNSVLACEISDSTGDLTALFYGRSRIPGLICGARVRFRGAVGIKNGSPIMINPAYELVGPGVSGKPAKDGQ
jgi:amino acid transporter